MDMKSQSERESVCVCVGRLFVGYCILYRGTEWYIYRYGSPAGKNIEWEKGGEASWVIPDTPCAKISCWSFITFTFTLRIG